MTRDPEPWDEARHAYRQLGPSETQLARMLDNVQRVSAASAASTRLTISKVSKIFLCVLTVTSATWLALEHAERTPAAAPPTHVSAMPAPASAPDEDVPPQESYGVEAPRAAPSPAPPRPSEKVRRKQDDASARISDPLAELTLLQRARRVVARDPSRALELAERHVTSFPRGAFAEERELLAIEALLRLGRRSDAEQRATRFTRRYPRSVHAHRLGVMLDERSD